MTSDSNFSLINQTFEQTWFEDLDVPWFEKKLFNQYVSIVRKHLKSKDCRSIVILTSGKVELNVLTSLYLELQMGLEVSKIALPNGLVTWYALNSELDGDSQIKWSLKFSDVGLTLAFSSPEIRGDTATERMYDARKAVQDFSNTLEGNPIICWLDSDLSYNTLVATKDGIGVQCPWPWLHMVWYLEQKYPLADLLVGDYTGDVPLPASSTLYTNLMDYIHSPTNVEPDWSMRDPAYDLTGENRLECIFPELKGHWNQDFPLEVKLLWHGTYSRPLVSNRAILSKPHKHRNVRGGNTIIFNLDLMKIPTPRFSFNSLMLRRGDSMWLTKVLSMGYESEHAPFPLLHSRGDFCGPIGELISNFIHRSISDLIGASILKSMIQLQNKSTSDYTSLFTDVLETRIFHLRNLMLDCKIILQSLKSETESTHLKHVLEAITRLTEELEKISLEELSNSSLLQHVLEYMEVDAC